MNEHMDQPQPFTPGITKAQVRQHAYMLFRDKLKDGHALSTRDWVLAEKDLIDSVESEELTATQPEGR